MIKAELDRWSTAHIGSSFVVELSCVPRVGETIIVHKSLMPSCYRDLDFDNYVRHGEPYAELKVVLVEHVIGPDGHLVRIDFDSVE